jgi:hypothetical protein
MVHGNKGKKKKAAAASALSTVDMFFKPQRATTAGQAAAEQVKRPRGRPPLIPGIGTKTKTTSKQGTGSSKLRLHFVPTPSLSSYEYKPSAKGSKKAKEYNPWEETVVHVPKPRPLAQETARKVMHALMLSDPMSLADLCKYCPDCSRESVQGVLEVLQVVGVVVQLTNKDAPKPHSASNVGVFCLAEFSKFDFSCAMISLKEEVEVREDANRKVAKRLETLQVRGRIESRE